MCNRGREEKAKTGEDEICANKTAECKHNTTEVEWVIPGVNT